MGNRLGETLLQQRRQRPRWPALITLTGGLVLMGALAFVSAGAFLASPPGTPVKADAIIALGGDSGYRAMEVGRLFRAGWAPRVLITGLEASPPESRSHYLNWRAMVLADSGVPPASMLFDAESVSSWDEAANTRKLMEARGWNRVLVVSDPPHLRRLDWTWRKAFAGSNLEYVLIAAPSAWWNADEWWRNEFAAKFVAQEVVKLAYYIVIR